MTYSLHPSAEQDIADTLDFYTEHAGLLVAQRFLDELERVAKLLVTHPGFGTPTTKGVAYSRCAFFRTPLNIGALGRAFESSSYAAITESQATAAQGDSGVVRFRDETPDPSIERTGLRHAAHFKR